MKLLNLNTWNRKEHFDFFKNYDKPFFGITAQVDVSIAYKKAKKMEASFYLFYLHKALVAIHQIKEFKYRITAPDEVTVFKEVRAGATVNRHDGTFSFSYLPYYEDFSLFSSSASKIIAELQQTKGLPHTDRSQDVVYFSAIPWVHFTSVEHALNSKVTDSVPKISFGKYVAINDSLLMPVSVHVHHALMDGIHVGKFFETYQQLLNE